jgi:hypothetical protein
VLLRYGNKRPSAPVYFWAAITGAGRGDTVTLNWEIRYDSGQDVGTCSATVHSGGKQNTRAVKYVQGKGYHLEARACGHHAGRTRCTTPLP